METKETTPGFKMGDGDKLPYHLVAPDALRGLVQVLLFGIKKGYEPRNWERGMAWSRPFAAIMRHLWAWWHGEDKDPESGLSHLDMAQCELMFLSAYEKRGMFDLDDRPVNPKPQREVRFQLDTKAIDKVLASIEGLNEEMARDSSGLTLHQLQTVKRHVAAVLLKGGA